MLTDRLLIAHLAATLLAVVASGLLVRRRVALCWSFFAFLLAALTFNRMAVYWPGRFWTFSFYSMKETLYFVLMVSIALEIWLRSYSSFPRARRRVGLALICVLLVTAAAVRVIPAHLTPFQALIGVLGPRQQAGGLALYAIIVSAAWWYRVPLHPLHRATLVGFAACLVANTVMATFAGFHGSVWLDRLRPVDQWAFVATTAWWAWAAWRPLRAPSPIVSRLQPWAHSW